MEWQQVTIRTDTGDVYMLLSQLAEFITEFIIRHLSVTDQAELVVTQPYRQKSHLLLNNDWT